MGQIFSTDNINFKEEPLLLGSGRNVSRLDLNIEQHIVKMTDNALAKMWFSHDFSYKADAEGYMKMPKALQKMYLKNFKFQTVMDSVASRTIAEVFSPITTNPMLEGWWTLHTFFESNIHSKTYADIIKALPIDAVKEFDNIMINKDIISRAAVVYDVFNEAVEYNARYVLRSNPQCLVNYNEDTHKKHIVKSLYALVILEAIFFKSSFITSFAFKENGLMTPSIDAISKIAVDK